MSKHPFHRLNTALSRTVTLLVALTLVASAVSAWTAPEESQFRATADLTDTKLPVLSLSNPNPSLIEVRVLAIRAANGELRSYRIRLEPLGSSTLSLESAEGFSHLTMSSTDPFSASLEKSAKEPAREIPVRDLRSPDKIGDECQLPFLECNGVWTLTCTNCSHGPFVDEGFVLSNRRVYWRNNAPCSPHVPWKTCTSQGLTATWSPTSGCPSSVTNSLGDTYSVDIDLFEPEVCVEDF